MNSELKELERVLNEFKKDCAKKAWWDLDSIKMQNLETSINEIRNAKTEEEQQTLLAELKEKFKVLLEQYGFRPEESENEESKPDESETEETSPLEISDEDKKFFGQLAILRNYLEDIAIPKLIEICDKLEHKDRTEEEESSYVDTLETLQRFENLSTYIVADIEEINSHIQKGKEILYLNKIDEMRKNYASDLVDYEQMAEALKDLEAESSDRKETTAQPRKQQKNRKNKPNDKKVNPKQVASVVAVLIAICCLTFGIAKGCSKDKKDNKNQGNSSSSNYSDTSTSNFGGDTSFDTSSESQEPDKSEPDTSVPDAEIETGFIDITDETQLAERAAEIVTYFDKYIPAYGITLENAEEMLSFINGGYVKDATLDGATNVIDTINLAMVSELGNAVDRANGVTTTRAEQRETFDYGLLFLDNSKGQRLARQISEIRSKMIANAGDIDITQDRIAFAELMNASWLLHGLNGQMIDAYTLETSGMEAIIDLMFLNTSALMGDGNLVTITDQLTGEPKTFARIQEEANYEDCPTQLIDDVTGEVIGETTLDKSTSDLLGALTEAINNKEIYEASSLTLTQN